MEDNMIVDTDTIGGLGHCCSPEVDSALVHRLRREVSLLRDCGGGGAGGRLRGFPKRGKSKRAFSSGSEADSCGSRLKKKKKSKRDKKKRDRSADLSELAWALRSRLAEKDQDSQRLQKEVARSKLELRRKDQQLRLLKSACAEKSAAVARGRQPRHLEVLFKARELELVEKCVSRKDLMAARSRLRSEMEQQAAKDYERRRRENALVLQEERYRRHRERKMRKAAHVRRVRNERRAFLEKQYQEEWNSALSQADTWALRSRPCLQNPEQGGAERPSLQVFGEMRVSVARAHFHKECEGEKKIRLVMLPGGDSRVIDGKAPVLVTLPYVPPGKHNVPALRVEVHGPKDDEMVLKAVTEVNLSACVNNDSVTREQVQLSHEYGILELDIEFISHHYTQQQQPQQQQQQQQPSRLAFSQPGTLRVRIVEAQQLKNVQRYLPQDPYVEVGLQPWNVVAKTPVKRFSGATAQWSAKEATFDLRYPGPPPQGSNVMPSLTIRVFDSEMIGLDNFIGSGAIALEAILLGKETRRFEVAVHDKEGMSAGYVVVDAAFAANHIAVQETSIARATTTTTRMVSARPEPLFIPNTNHTVAVAAAPSPMVVSDPETFAQFGKICVRAVSGHDLRVVQRVGKQDPFVVARLETTGTEARCKTHNSGGKNPSWDAASGLMELAFSGAKGQPEILLTVFDAELVLKDREIGRGVLRLNELSENVTKHNVALVCPAKKSQAGFLEVETWFEVARTASPAMARVKIKSPASVSPGRGGSPSPPHSGLSRKSRSPVTSVAGEEPRGLAISKRDHALLSQTGTLVCQAVSCVNLKKPGGLFKHDPLVRFTLLPWKCSGKTKSRSGSDPRWENDQDGLVKLEYSGAPPQGELPQVLIEVMDEQLLVSDRVMCSALHTIEPDLFDTRQAKQGATNTALNVQLHDAKGKDAGVISLYLGFMPSAAAAAKNPVDGGGGCCQKCGKLGSGRSCCRAASVAARRAIECNDSIGLRALAVEANELKSVQCIGVQDPYVVVTHVRSGTSARTKCVANGGKSVKWDRHKHDAEMLVSLPGYSCKGREPVLVQVFDEEAVMSDRLIGEVTIDAWSDILDHKSHGTGTPISLRLVDKKGQEAGVLQLCLMLEPKLISSRSPAAAAAVGPGPKQSKSSSQEDIKIGAIWMRVVRGRNLVVAKPGTQFYARVSFGDKTWRTKPCSGSNPIWSTSTSERHLFRFQQEDMDLGALMDEQVTVTLLQKGIRDHVVGTFSVPLSGLPCEYQEDILRAEASSCTWYGLSNGDGDIQISGVILRKPRIESQAAERIQAVRRAQLARRKSRALSEEKVKQGCYEWAASNIQRVFRGRQTRKKTIVVQQNQARLHEMDARARGLIDQQCKRLEQSNAATVRIQRHFRGYQVRRRASMGQAGDHIVRIQACVRRFRARTLYKKSRTLVPAGVFSAKVLRATHVPKAGLLGLSAKNQPFINLTRDPYVKISVEPWAAVHKTAPGKALSGGRNDEIAFSSSSSSSSLRSDAFNLVAPPRSAHDAQPLLCNCAQVRFSVSVYESVLLGSDKLVAHVDNWERFGSILYHNRPVREEIMYVSLGNGQQEKSGRIALAVSWTPESVILNGVTSVQSHFRRKQEQDRYQALLLKRRKAQAMLSRLNDSPKSTNSVETAFSADANGIGAAIKGKKGGFGAAASISPQGGNVAFTVNPAALGSTSPVAKMMGNTTVGVNVSPGQDKHGKSYNVSLQTGLGQFDFDFTDEDKKNALLKLQSLARSKRDRARVRQIRKERTLASKSQQVASLHEEIRRHPAEKAAAAAAESASASSKDVCRLRLLEVVDLPKSAKTSLNPLNKAGFHVRASLLPGNQAVGISKGSDARGEWLDQSESKLEFGLPRRQDGADWPVLRLELMHKSRVPRFTSRLEKIGWAEPVASADYALFEHVANYNIESTVTIPLKDKFGVPSGKLLLNIQVDLVELQALKDTRNCLVKQAGTHEEKRRRFQEAPDKILIASSSYSSGAILPRKNSSSGSGSSSGSTQSSFQESSSSYSTYSSSSSVESDSDDFAKSSPSQRLISARHHEEESKIDLIHQSKYSKK